MTRPMELGAFWKAYSAMLASFITNRLLLQTDLLMVAPLGPAATAAFGVPGRLMVLDAILVFALAPVVTTAISRQGSRAEKQAILTGSLSWTLALSLLATVAGLLVYPRVVDLLVADPGIRALARVAVRWMTLSIPVRMLACIATMGLFACGEGRRLVSIYGLTLTVNAGLDWFLIHRLGLGLGGAFLATLLVSSLELAWLLAIIAKQVGRFPLSGFSLHWAGNLMGQAGAEFLRLVSWQVEGCTILSMVASKAAWLPIFSAYGVISECSGLLMVPVIALMRTGAMHVASISPVGPLAEGWRLLEPVRRLAQGVSALLGLGLVFGATRLGVFAYHLSDQRLRWWSAFMTVYGLGLPWLVHGCLVRACYQARDRYDRLARVEIGITWVLFIPSLWLALLRANPWAFFLAFLAREGLVLLWLKGELAGVRRPVETGLRPRD